MKIIVTGGAGFIGSHVVDRFIALGHRVAVIDNLATGFRGNLHPKARFYEDDIRNTTRIREIFRREKPEIVCHHAALAEVVKSIRDPLPTFSPGSPRSPSRASATRTARRFLDPPALSGATGRSREDLDAHFPAP